VIVHLRGVFLPDEAEREAWVVDGRLTFERPQGPDRVETIASAGWVVPGFVDAHCHVGISPEGHVVDRDGQERQALEDRAAGALLLRDVGSPVDASWVAEREDLPRLIRAGRHIARTRRYIRDQGVEVEPRDLVAEVEHQADRSDGWIKIVADWIDREHGDLAPTFPVETLTMAVDRAHELGARVAIHAFGEDAIKDGITAGVDSIEHATGLTDSALDRLSGRDVAIVPTLINIDQFPAIARAADARFPRYAAHMRALYASSRARVANAWEAGVPVFVGTDAGGTLPHGLVRSEITALVGAGLPLADVVANASWRARAWLGLPGLEEGAPADLIVFDADPRVDMTVMYRPRAVVLRGRVVSHSGEVR
jgi:imidazolonepropionase-like amidohydrolase